ncbi:MAG: TlyA family RNA methyltransferase [Deltaproteobacteria bacterium]|nr:TlyA family RNA methyltransferase [Deltaproteobacteria bacterium]
MPSPNGKLSGKSGGRPGKARIDRLLMDRELASSLTDARALLMAGEVLVNDVPVTKPGATVPADATVRLRSARSRYVSRGGLKLEGALSDLNVMPNGLVCADIGASTGGFTDCLLQHGAARVHAVDVGQALIAEKLRQDPRVILHEKLNARFLKPEDLGEPVELAVADCSFVSLTLLLPAIRTVLAPGGTLLALVKPQFEAARGEVEKGGIVRDPAIQFAAVEKIGAAAEVLGFRGAGSAPSRLAGADGNQEYFLKLVAE